jgi:rod shape-determining protein MreC
MMISRSNNKKRLANKRTIIGVVFLLILFLILGRIGFPSLGGGASKPVVSTGGLFKNLGNGFSVFFSSRKAYENKISELEQKLATLEAESFLLSVVKAENTELKNLLGKEETSASTILAKVLVKQNTNTYGTMILDQGSTNGVLVGAKVYALGAVALGEVVEVYKKTSLVRLFSSGGVETPARFSISNLDVTLLGRGGGAFAVYLPHDVFVDAQEKITLLSSENFVIAEFVSSATDPRDPEQTIYLRTPININTLNFVQIEKLENF